MTGTRSHRMAVQRVARRFLAAAKDDGPLTEAEKRELGKANMWVMDWEMDGLGKFPKEIEKIVELRRTLKPSEARVLLEWFRRTAPGNY